MYYVIVSGGQTPFRGKTVAIADTSAEARRLAVQMDHRRNGRPVGRTFFLDQETYIRWRVAGLLELSDGAPE
ncbi:MAG: hypothetical protein K9L70_00430 [Thiohalocapsa sp.]|nr:hypothetical protein [Thiohalocapsa sp.]MCF7990078.1 hypothetical protein [Thiohalocapsa sp.]